MAPAPFLIVVAGGDSITLIERAMAMPNLTGTDMH
jgi:hypothetical protein